MTVYLDHNASAPLHPEVLEAMLPLMRASHGNASSLHQSGRFLRSAIETARAQVAALVNAEPSEIIFTAGGSEANNLAIKGFVEITPEARFATSAIEHASVLAPMRQMEDAGCLLEILPVTEQGVLDPAIAQSILKAFKPDLLSLQLANNESGALIDVAAVIDMDDRDAMLVHSDATQAAGKIPVDYKALDLDLMTLSAHKLQGPQGCGALVTRRSSAMKRSLIAGGPQESNRRAGTENAALLAGFGKACELARINLQERHGYLLELRAYFEQQLHQIDGVAVFAERSDRLPNTSFFAIPYYHGETLLMQLDQAGFELASGSACHSEVTEPSHVLSAMGIDDDLALNAVRVSFGMDNTREQVDQLIATLQSFINQIPAAMRRAAG